jgi:hypothetical protein
MEVAVPVKPIFGDRKAFMCAILITPDWMIVDSSDLVDIYYLCLTSRKVL